MSNSLPQGVQCSLYADDSKIFAVNSPTDLQAGIDSVCKWAKTWEMDINLSKTKIMRIGKKHPDCTFYMDGNEIEETDHFKDLGIIYDNSLSFSRHISSISSRGKAKSNFILKSFATRNPAILFKLFSTYVRPILEFSCEVWDPTLVTLIKEVETVQRRFTKRIFNRVGMTDISYEERLAALETTTLEKRRHAAGLSYMYKMLLREVDLPYSDFFQCSRRTIQRRKHSYFILFPRANHESFKSSFMVRYINEWNQLPPEFFYSITSSTFRQKVLKHPT